MDSPIDRKEEARQQLRQAALEYHEFPRPGKISVTPTKQLTNQRDLSLAYTPGVAAACEESVADPANGVRYTMRSNLVAGITNGTAVLGLGNIGPLAAKPVMEGKAVLFKKFAGIDVFDIEINETDPAKLCDIIAALEPTFGGVNLEDIKAPECFYIERKLRERMKIPVFHDDQHGTAIIVGASILNGLKEVGKNIKECKLKVSDAGDSARGSLAGARRRGDGHRSIGLSVPGQQRAVLPVYLPRCALLRRDHHHARNGNRRGACDCRAGAGRTVRHRCYHLRHHQSVLRAGLPDSQALRPASGHQDCAGGRPGGGAMRRGTTPDPGYAGLYCPPRSVRVPHQLLHEADFLGCEEGARRQKTHRVRRGRGSTRAAGGASGGR